MQSKWLTWQPGSVGFEGSPSREDSIVQSGWDEEDRIVHSFTSPIIENTRWNVPTKPAKPLSPDSPYSGLACLAMQRVTAVCPPGALKWAREAHPTLTDKIDVALIARLSHLWSIHAPLPEFQAALDELVLAHSEVGRVFTEKVRS